MSTQMEEPSDLIGLLGLTEKVIKSSHIKIVTSTKSQYTLSSAKVTNLSDETVVLIPDRRDVLITGTLDHYSTDRLVDDVCNGHDIDVQIFIYEDSTPIVFKNGYVSSVNSSRNTIVIIAEHVEQYEETQRKVEVVNVIAAQKEIKKREISHPNLKRFRIMTEED